MPGYKSKTQSKKNLKSSNKAKNGGRRRKQTMKKVRRGRKVMRGGGPSQKYLTLPEIFALLKEYPEELEAFRTLISKNWLLTKYNPDQENLTVYDDTNFEMNPALKKMEIQSNNGGPTTYPLSRIIDNLPLSLYGNLKKVKEIFEKYNSDTPPYTNEYILRLIDRLGAEEYDTLRDSLLATVQKDAKLPEDCFVIRPEPSTYESFPKPIFSKENLERLLKNTVGLNKIFTDAINKAREDEAKKWENTSLRTLDKIMKYM